MFKQPDARDAVNDRMCLTENALGQNLVRNKETPPAEKVAHPGIFVAGGYKSKQLEAAKSGYAARSARHKVTSKMRSSGRSGRSSSKCPISSCFWEPKKENRYSGSKSCATP